MPLKTARTILALTVVYAFWGSNYVAMKVTTTVFPPFLLLTARWLSAGCVLLVISAVVERAHPERRLTRAQLTGTLVLGAAFMTGGNGGLFFASQFLTSGSTALVAAAMPLIATLFGVILLRQRPTAWALLGLCIGAAGLAWIFAPAAAHGQSRIGIIVGLGADAIWAAGVLAAPVVAVPRRPLLAMALQMLWGGLLLVPISILHGDAAHLTNARVDRDVIVAFGWLVFCSGIIAFVAYGWLLRNVSLTISSTYSYVAPVIAVLLGAALLREPLTPRTLAGTVAVMAGVGLMMLRPHAIAEAIPRPLTSDGACKRPRPQTTVSGTQAQASARLWQ